MKFENFFISVRREFNLSIFGVFLKSCHETNMSVFDFFRYCRSFWSFFRVLNSISSKNGLYSDINFRMEILSFSLPENCPPSFFGLNVQTHLEIFLPTSSSIFGTSDGLTKSSLISAYSDFSSAFFKRGIIFFEFLSPIETQVLYFIFYFSKIFVRYFHSKMSSCG